MNEMPQSGAFVDRLAAAQARIAEVHRDSPILITLSAAENAARLQAHRDANHGRDALLRDKAEAILALVRAAECAEGAWTAALQSMDDDNVVGTQEWIEWMEANRQLGEALVGLDA